MRYINWKLGLYITIFTICLPLYATDEDDGCPDNLKIFFSQENENLAEKDFARMEAHEKSATDLHYEREYAETALVNAKTHNDVIDPQDLLLIRNCSNLDKKNPNSIELDRCMEKLHDAMEDELAARFKILKNWEKKCKTYQDSKCNIKIDKLSRGLNVDLEIEENDVCKICEYASKPLDNCKR